METSEPAASFSFRKSMTLPRRSLSRTPEASVARMRRGGGGGVSVNGSSERSVMGNAAGLGRIGRIRAGCALYLRRERHTPHPYPLPEGLSCFIAYNCYIR